MNEQLKIFLGCLSTESQPPSSEGTAETLVNSEEVKINKFNKTPDWQNE